MNPLFWKGKRVFITGHTGFKGAWLSLWLRRLGADVTGYSLAPPTTPSLFELCRLDREIHSLYGDVRDKKNVASAIRKNKPHIIFHMAAQSLVRVSYVDPVYTYDTNVMGTAHVLDAARAVRSVRAMVFVTSDKCYENTGRRLGYKENDPLGGTDPYSNSKGCAELVVSAYRKSFFSGSPHVGVASARAGNVIGGGDWAQDRLIPDLMKAVTAKRPVVIRHPKAVRPWQFVLDPLSGYLRLVQKLWTSPLRFSEGWNFGPSSASAKSVEWIANQIKDSFPRDLRIKVRPEKRFYESQTLALNSSKARKRLGWRPRLSIDQTIQWTLRWYEAFRKRENLLDFTDHQIDMYQKGNFE